MSEYEQVIDEIVKHGVVVKVDKIVDDNYVTGEIRYVGCVVKLDFSEHDKVFEDKIAELENIINHKLGNWDKLGITYQEILCMKAENDLLKQRIAELESKETEKLTKINLNDRIKVKLTPLGAEIYYHQYDELNKKIKDNGGTQLEPIMPQIDKDGYTEFTFHHFISLYGNYIGICKPNVIEPLDIVFCE